MGKFQATTAGEQTDLEQAIADTFTAGEITAAVAAGESEAPTESETEDERDARLFAEASNPPPPVVIEPKAAEPEPTPKPKRAKAAKEPKAAKAAKAPKPPKAAAKEPKPPKAAAAKESLRYVKGPQKLTDDTLLVPVVGYNYRRPGSEGHAHLAVILAHPQGVPYGAYKQAIDEANKQRPEGESINYTTGNYGSNHIRWDLARGKIKLIYADGTEFQLPDVPSKYIPPGVLSTERNDRIQRWLQDPGRKDRQKPDPATAKPVTPDATELVATGADLGVPDDAM